MPMTSSMMAAESTVVPTRVLSLPNSRRVSTVMPTLVAARMQPTNSALSSLSESAAAPKPPMKHSAPIVPSAMGTITPAQAMAVAARPLFFSSPKSVSNPLENRMNTTPTWEKLCSTSISASVGWMRP